MNIRKIFILTTFSLILLIGLFVTFQYLFGFLLIQINNLHTPLTFNLLHKIFIIRNKIHFNNQILITAFYFFSIAFPLILTILFLILSLVVRRKLHGNTRFANFTEIKKSGLIKKPKDHTADILLGKFNKTYLSLSGQLSAFVAAAPRTGKGWAIVLPNIVHFQGSIVIVDLKYENYIKTAGFNKKRGYEVYALNPEGLLPMNESMIQSNNQEFYSHCWNPFTYVSKDSNRRYQDLYDIANILYPANPNDKNKFFTESAQMLFVAICMSIIDTDNNLTMANVLRMVAIPYGFKDINEYLQKLSKQKNIQEDTKILLQQFISGNSKTMNDVLSTFKVPLNIFIDKRVEALTSNDSFDLRDLRKKPMAIYVCVQPTKINTFSHLIRLFFSQIITLIEKQGLPENNPQLKYQCLLLLDEFYSLGYMPQIQKAISVLPGYNLRCIVIIQNKNQLYEVYGKDGAESFIKYFHTYVMFTPNNQQDAQEYSDSLGYATVSNKSKSFANNRNKHNSATISHSDQKRAVMLPDELKIMKFENCIICSQYNLPIFAKKIIYKDDKKLKNKFFLPIPKIPVLKLLSEQENTLEQPKSELFHQMYIRKFMDLSKLDEKTRKFILEKINQRIKEDF